MTILSIQLLALHCPPIKFDYYTVDFVPALLGFLIDGVSGTSFFFLLNSPIDLTAQIIYFIFGARKKILRRSWLWKLRDTTTSILFGGGVLLIGHVAANTEVCIHT